MATKTQLLNQGFSSADPSLARGPQVAAQPRRRSSSGRRKTPSTQSVDIKGDTVFIDGKGFSVAPALQAEFIRKRTRGGTSARAAIQQAETLEAAKVAQIVQRPAPTPLPTRAELAAKEIGGVSKFEQQVREQQKTFGPGVTFEDIAARVGREPQIRKTRLERVEEFTERLLTPEGVRELASIPAEFVLQAGPKLAEFTEDVLVTADKPFGELGLTRESRLFRAEAPITRETAKEILTDIFVFSAFQPFIQTATAKAGTAKAEAKTATDKKKIEALKKLREELQKASKAKVKSFAKKQIDNINKLPISQQEKTLRLRNLEIFVREARGQIAVQDGKIVPVLDIGRIPKAVKPIPVKEPISIIGPDLAKLTKLKEVLTAVTATERVVAGKTNKLKDDIKKVDEQLKKEANEARKQNLKAKKDSLQKTLGSVTGAAVASLTAQLDNAQAKTGQLNRQLEQTKQSPFQDTLTRQRQDSLTRQISRQDVATRQISKQISKLAKTVPVKVLLKPGVKKRIEERKKKKFVGVGTAKVPGGWQPLIKSRGKLLRLSKPFRTKQQAVNFARYVVDNSTSAQYTLKQVPRVKKFSKKMVPPTSGLKFREFRKVGKKKVSIVGEIELRKHRISSRGEIQGLRAAKLVQQRFGKGKRPIGGKAPKKLKPSKKIGGKVSLRAPAKPRKKLKK